MVNSSFFIIDQLWIISFYFTGTKSSINSKTVLNAVNNKRENTLQSLKRSKPTFYLHEFSMHLL